MGMMISFDEIDEASFEHEEKYKKELGELTRKELIEAVWCLRCKSNKIPIPEAENKRLEDVVAKLSPGMFELKKLEINRKNLKISLLKKKIKALEALVDFGERE